MEALGDCTRGDLALLLKLGAPVTRRRGGKLIAHKGLLDRWLMDTIAEAHRLGVPLEFLGQEGGYGEKEGGGSAED